MSSAPKPKVKPRMRGVLHELGFVAALGGLVFLAMSPLKGAQYVAGVVYGICLCALLGISALYHRPMWAPRHRAVLRRFDHAGIYLLIAGTYTPMAVLDAQGELPLNLYVMWGAALFGILVSTVWTSMPRPVKAGNYVVLGLAAAPLVFRLLSLVGFGRVAVLLLGSLVYMLGAVVYARRWPNPRPLTFGYHEVFHALVLVAAGLQYSVVLDLQYASS
ncbi:MAG: hemolysin III family protein [Myxococcaceae bacterium]|nr:hemolysin III family protein [Myxococcaceae bacterium]